MSDEMERKLQAIIEELYTVLANATDYSPEANKLYGMLGMACGKNSSKDTANWAWVQHWNSDDETFEQLLLRTTENARKVIGDLKLQIMDDYRKQGYIPDTDNETDD